MDPWEGHVPAGHAAQFPVLKAEQFCSTSPAQCAQRRFAAKRLARLPEDTAVPGTHILARSGLFRGYRVGNRRRSAKCPARRHSTPRPPGDGEKQSSKNKVLSLTWSPLQGRECQKEGGLKAPKVAVDIPLLSAASENTPEGEQTQGFGIGIG